MELRFCQFVKWSILEGHSNKNTSINSLFQYLFHFNFYFSFLTFLFVFGISKKYLHKPHIFLIFVARRNFRELCFWRHCSKICEISRICKITSLKVLKTSVLFCILALTTKLFLQKFIVTIVLSNLNRCLYIQTYLKDYKRIFKEYILFVKW